jgi:hypothetical protein
MGTWNVFVRHNACFMDGLWSSMEGHDRYQKDSFESQHRDFPISLRFYNVLHENDKRQRTRQELKNGND